LHIENAAARHRAPNCELAIRRFSGPIANQFTFLRQFMSLSFHKTFPLECENIAKLLRVVAVNPIANNTDIAESTGIGIGKGVGDGKVRPTISYADYAGLIWVSSDSAPRRIELTEVGKIVLEYDGALKKPVTQWVLHYHLSKEGGRARVWNYFTQAFLPFNSSFEKSALERGLEEKFAGEATVKSINPGVLLRSYLDSNALGLLRLIRESGRNKYTRGRPYIPTPYIIGYILAEIWDAQHPTRMMIDEAKLSEPGHLGPTIGLKDAELQEQLNALTHLGVIGQMREAPPFQVVKQWDNKLELLRKAYEEGV
jgi:hypothetical protein